MIVASIDIGTNTVLLLIARIDTKDGKIIPILNDYRLPRIGKGIKKSGRISNERIINLFSVLREYKSLIDNHNCDKVLVFGTNAFRIADNSIEIVEKIKSELSFDLNVISGDEEAEYAYLGAISNLQETKSSTVIDIGGSSTEIINGESLKIQSKISLQLGSVTATEQYLNNSPPRNDEIEKMKTEIINHFQTNKIITVAPKVIAIAGTATTLACMKLGLYEFNEKLVDNYNLKLEDLRYLVKDLSTLNAFDILDKYGTVVKGREDIILAGAIILLEFMIFYNVNSVLVSTKGIRYGAIVRYLSDLTKELHFE
jgi:exopolyphosphatase/guanosine-5'-triphosphate,3'-diphosphate pyrophosphatase